VILAMASEIFPLCVIMENMSYEVAVPAHENHKLFIGVITHTISFGNALL